MRSRFEDVDELHQRLRRSFGMCFLLTVLLSVLLIDTGLIWEGAVQAVRLCILGLLGGLLIVTSWHWMRMRDLSQEMSQGLTRLVFVDYLTKVYNSRYLDERLEYEIQRARQRREPVSVLYIDLDDFKQINDTFGHHAGDDVLEQFGQLLRQSMRDDDAVGRLGGDEFLIVLPNTPAASARKLGARIRAVTASHPFLHHGRTLRVHMSVGLASFPDDATDKDQLLAAADRAMYTAKRTTKGRLRVAEPVPHQAEPHTPGIMRALAV